MLNRLVSNFVLGFFVIVLVVVYSITKQVPAYPGAPATQKTTTVATAETNDPDMRTAIAGMESTPSEESPTVTLPNGAKVNVLVADTDATRQRGLSGSEPLGASEGMLFVFEKAASYAIWMKDMKYDLDIIWMDSEGRVVHMVEDAKAPASATENLPVYKNSDPALYVLELPARSASQAGVGVGTVLSIS